LPACGGAVIANLHAAIAVTKKYLKKKEHVAAEKRHYE
jgi:hypothetical protein